MAEINFEQVLDAARQLPPEQQRQLIDYSLTKQLEPQPKKMFGRRVVPPVPSKDRTLEMQWLKEHSREYAGQWVGLEGNQLIATGSRGVEVFNAARAAGIDIPFIVQVEDPEGLPFAGGGV